MQAYADELLAGLGDRAPRIACVPPAADYSLGHAVIALAEIAGFRLLPWQRVVILLIFARREDGKWAAFEVVLVIPRQNGKNAVLEVVQLGKFFVVRDRLQVHTAHLGETSDEAFGRLRELIEGCPELLGRVRRNGFHKTNGKAGITLIDGCRIKFRTRTAGGGRGLSGDTVVGDEAFNFQESTHGSLFPLMSARSVLGNPQMIYTSSAVDQNMPGHEHGVVLARLRERGIAAAGNPGLAAAERLLYLEWSVDEDEYRRDPEGVAADERSAVQANPSLDDLISREHVATERKSMSPRTFGTERLGVGDWPATSGVEQIIKAEWLDECLDGASAIKGTPEFVFDVKPDLSAGTIAAAGRRADGKMHYEVVAHNADNGEVGIDWMPERIAEVLRNAGAKEIAYEKGPASVLLKRLEALGVTAVPIKPEQSAEAFGLFFNEFKNGTGRHRGQPVLEDAIKGAAKQPLGDASWKWSRKSSDVDISPLVGVTLAGWRAAGKPRAKLRPLARRGQ